MLVLNKPVGVISQVEGSASQIGDLLREIALRYGLDGEFFPVHRLDKNVSGCIAFARSKGFAREFSRQFQDGAVSKTYLAIIKTPRPLSASKGQICVGLCYHDGRPSLSKDKTAKMSATDWEIISTSHQFPLALVRLHLLTGYKHQLRVHMANCLQTPIVGDELYSTVSEGLPTELSIPARVCLHSSRISFWRYKRSGKRVRLTIQSQLPLDFLQLCSEAGLQVPRDEVENMVTVDGVVQGQTVPDLDGHLCS